MIKARKHNYGSVIGFLSSSGKNDHNITPVLHTCIVDFGNLTLQLSIQDLKVLKEGLVLALNSEKVPDSLFKSPVQSWHTIKKLSGDNKYLSFRYGQVSWRLEYDKAKSILADIEKLLETLSAA
ncbi:MAG: hypothetical protein QM500_08805 [Methylococcales bacterium]